MNPGSDAPEGQSEKLVPVVPFSQSGITSDSDSTAQSDEKKEHTTNDISDELSPIKRSRPDRNSVVEITRQFKGMLESTLKSMQGDGNANNVQKAMNTISQLMESALQTERMSHRASMLPSKVWRVARTYEEICACFDDLLKRVKLVLDSSSSQRISENRSMDNGGEDSKSK